MSHPMRSQLRMPSMSIVTIDQASQVDTMSFRLVFDRTVTPEDVKVSVHVTVLVDKDDDNNSRLGESVREAMGRFLQADWTLSNLKRDVDATGFERMTLIAHTRVPIHENHHLHERAQIASRPGLMLSHPTVSYALATRKVRQIVEVLRDDALVDIGRQVLSVSEITGRAWRIGHLEFGEDPRDDYRLSTKGARRDQAEDDHSDYQLTGAERVTLSVNVTLKARAE